MIIRNTWLSKIQNAWQHRPIVWLSGVRRVGKTSIAKMLPNADYFNCDLPSVQRRLADPELFLNSISPSRILIFDEIHRLQDPSLLMKIASDERPDLKILATGSSSLAATAKFRDSLTGRKTEIRLCPVTWEECLNDFNTKNLEKRLFHGGMPENLLSDKLNNTFFAEWLDSFYARDIQELFAIRQRSGFLKLIRLLLNTSGGLLNVSSLAKHCALSRPTVNTYLEALQIAHALYLLKPFHDGGRQEILKQPKAYAFDTGMVCWQKGWQSPLRPHEIALLWEHLVLDSLLNRFPHDQLSFWRLKSGAEIDFIIKGRRDELHTVECKISPDKFTSINLQKFRQLYPKGQNFLLCPNVNESYTINISDCEINVCDTQHLSKLI